LLVAEAPYERLSLLRALLKFVLHMMQTSGTADRLRNLIDSTLPTNLLQVLAYSKTFGPNVFSLATNIMSTFIHNEPTSLTILQELKLPQTFLFSIKQHIPFSPEVISAIPTAFGAVCLNQPGLDMYNTVAPMDTFLEVFTTEANLRTLLENDVPQLVGQSLDELMRHQTSLKDSIVGSVVAVARKVNEIGLTFQPSAKDDSALFSGLPAAEDEPGSAESKAADEQRKDHVICQYIDVVAKILEGLFSSVGHAKDFIRLNGVGELLNYYKFPAIPYDFATSNSSYALSHLLRLLMEVESKTVVAALLKVLTETLAEAKGAMKDVDGSYIGQLLESGRWSFARGVGCRSSYFCLFSLDAGKVGRRQLGLPRPDSCQRIHRSFDGLFLYPCAHSLQEHLDCPATFFRKRGSYQPLDALAKVLRPRDLPSQGKSFEGLVDHSFEESCCWRRVGSSANSVDACRNRVSGLERHRQCGRTRRCASTSWCVGAIYGGSRDAICGRWPDHPSGDAVVRGGSRHEFATEPHRANHGRCGCHFQDRIIRWPGTSRRRAISG